MTIVNLDHAATSGVREEVFDAMMPYFKGEYWNASGAYLNGRKTRKAVEEARALAAECIHAEPEEIFFTSGGSESDTWAIKGMIRNRSCRFGSLYQVAYGETEHHAVLNTIEQIIKDHLCIGTPIYVLGDGRADMECIKHMCSHEGAVDLVTLMTVNNETGTINPIRKIADYIHDNNGYMHTDAVQAYNTYPVNVQEMGVDLLSLSGHKFGAPKGIGLLYVQKGIEIEPLICGGKQERGVRGGTENVPYIVGLATAMRLAKEERDELNDRYWKMRNRLKSGILDSVPMSYYNGADDEHCVSNILNMRFDGVNGENLQLRLDLLGIQIGVGSACNTGDLKPSHVLTAMGLSEKEAHESVRFSFGRDNTMDDIEAVLAVLPAIVEEMRYS